jgi:hypothetical protein
VTPRRWLWLAAALLYGAFWLWYTPLGGPLTPVEVENFLARLEAGSEGAADPGRLERLRRFMAEDSGRQFVMVNVIDLADQPPALPATGAGAPASALLGYYMAHMYPALLGRACHPVFVGRAVGGALDLAGLSGAEAWTQAALVRYRSRRDMLEIATNPAFARRHAYKLAALEKTIAFPVEGVLYLSDARFLLALILFGLTACVDLFLRRPRPVPSAAAA